MATVKLIDPTAPQLPKMNRPCQITLEPHEAAALMLWCYGVEGSPEGPRGAVDKVWRGIANAYGIDDLYGSEMRSEFSRRFRAGEPLVKGWPSIPGIVDAPKVTP